MSRQGQEKHVIARYECKIKTKSVNKRLYAPKGLNGEYGGQMDKMIIKQIRQILRKCQRFPRATYLMLRGVGLLHLFETFQDENCTAQRCEVIPALTREKGRV